METDSAEGFASATLNASYLHLHWAGTPAIATRFLGSVREFACENDT